MLRTSGVSSGATSGSSGSNPAYWRPAQPAAAAAAAARADQRKFSTLSRAQQQQQQQQQRGKSSQVLRTRSFQVGNNHNSSNSGKLSCFSPSENSAFHCISANNNRGEAAQLSQSQVRQRTVISILTLVLRRIRR